jgi:hypothetical protein
MVEHSGRLETDLLPRHEIALMTEFEIVKPPLDLRWEFEYGED